MTRRQSAIAHRHEQLGCELEEWGGVGTAYNYKNQSTEDEHDCIRERVGVFDVTGLYKRWVTGSDAEKVLNHACVRDISKLVDGKCCYTPLLTDEGTIHDDAIVYRFSGDKYLFVHGTGQSEKYLNLSADGLDCKIEMDDDIQDLAVQGPKSLDVINAICADDASELVLYGHMDTTINGHPATISRTGFTGERGYEIYCNHSVLEEVYDKVLEAGKPYDIMSTGFDCLDKARIEFALLFYPYDIDETTTVWEIGLDWTVPKNKADDYRGRTASDSAKGNEKIHLVGLTIDHNDICSEDAELFVDGSKVGKITSPAWSHRMNASISLAHLNHGYESVGTKVDVKGGGMDTTAVVSEVPFYDPTKQKLRG